VSCSGSKNNLDRHQKVTLVTASWSKHVACDASGVSSSCWICSKCHAWYTGSRPLISAFIFHSNKGPVLLDCVYMPVDYEDFACLENYTETFASISALMTHVW